MHCKRNQPGLLFVLIKTVNVFNTFLCIFKIIGGRCVYSKETFGVLIMEINFFLKDFIVRKAMKWK